MRAPFTPSPNSPKAKPAATSRPTSGRVREAAKAAAAPAPRPRPSATAQRAAVQRYTGVMAAPLNELSDAEQRAHDVAARRQADAQQYASYVMGQQGAIQAAAIKQDQANMRAHQGIQTGTVAANMQLQGALQQQRAAQGIAGAVPAQQLNPLVDESVRTNTILGGMGQHLNTRADVNQGRAAFLKAAAQAQMMANQRGIAGDEFNQVSDIRREKVGVLGQREQVISSERQAAAQAAADVQEAKIRADEQAADRASRESIAQNAVGTRRDIASAQLQNSALQGRANRRVRLKTAALGARAQGYVSPADKRRRATSVRKAETQRGAAVELATQAVKLGGVTNPRDVRAYLNSKMKGLPPEIQDYALAAALKRRAGVTRKGQPSAARRYYDMLRRIQSGEINY